MNSSTRKFVLLVVCALSLIVCLEGMARSSANIAALTAKRHLLAQDQATLVSLKSRILNSSIDAELAVLKLDVILYNARATRVDSADSNAEAMLHEYRKELLDVKLEEWSRVLASNLSELDNDIKDCRSKLGATTPAPTEDLDNASQLLPKMKLRAESLKRAWENYLIDGQPLPDRI